jgi:type I site-specific restriction endonuclease
VAIKKRSLSERGTCTKFFNPAFGSPGWDEITQVRQEVSAIKFQTIFRVKIVAEGP